MGKSFVKNSIYNILYKLLSVIFPLIYTSYASYILMADGVGKVAFSQNIVSYFVVFASLGIPSYGIREIAKTSDKDRDRVFSELFIINFICTIILSLAYVGFVFTYIDDQSFLLYLATGITLFLNIFNVDWFYQGIEEFRYITIRSFIVKIISLLCLFIFIKNKNDYICFAFVSSLGVVLNNIYNIVHIHKYTHLIFKDLNFLKHFKPVLVMLFASLAVEMYTKIDVLMLGVLKNDTEVGFYNNAVRMIRIISTLTSAMAGVLLPRLTYYFNIGDNVKIDALCQYMKKAILLVAVPAVIGIMLVSQQLIPLIFGNSFTGAIPTMQILSPLIVICALGNLYGTQILISSGKEKYVLFSTIIGSFINIVLNSLLISTLGANGAAIASVCSELAVMLYQYYYARKNVYLQISSIYYIKIIISSILMFTFVLFLKRMIEYSEIIKLSLECLGGIIIFIGVSVLLKNELIIDLFTRLKKLRI